MAAILEKGLDLLLEKKAPERRLARRLEREERKRGGAAGESRPHVFSKVTKTPITLVVIIHRERLRAQRGRAIPRVDVLPSPLAASRTLSAGRSYDGDARPLDSCPNADGAPSVRAKKGRQGSHGKRL
jgi:hypothetical protein